MIYKLSTIIKNKNIKKTYNNKLGLKENIINFYNFIKKENKNIKKLEINVNKKNYKFIKTKTLYIIKKINLKGGEIQKEKIDDFIEKTNLMSSYDINSKLEYIEGKDDVIDETIIDNLLLIKLDDNIYNNIYSLYTYLNQTITKDMTYDVKKILVDIYNNNKNYGKDEISIETFDFFKHFNYSLAVKKIDIYKELKIFINKINKIRKLYLEILYKIINDLICDLKTKCFLNNAGTDNIKSDYDISLKKQNYDEIQYSEFIYIIYSYNKIYNDNLFINNILDINFYFGEYIDIDNHDMMCILEYCNLLKFHEKSEIFYEKQLRWSVERIKENDETIKITENDEINSIITYYKKIKENYNKLIPFCDDDNSDDYIVAYDDNMIRIINYNLTLLQKINNDKTSEHSENIELLYDNVSEIQYMSNDAYYSVGSYLHIVGILQTYLNTPENKTALNIIENFDKKLLIDFYIMSFNENLGFLLEKIKNNKSGSKNISENDKELKYIYRCFNAITIIQNLKENKKNIFIIDISILQIKKILDPVNIESIIIILINYYVFNLITNSKIYEKNRYENHYKFEKEMKKISKFMNENIEARSDISELPQITIIEIKNILLEYYEILNFKTYSDYKYISQTKIHPHIREGKYSSYILKKGQQNLFNSLTRQSEMSSLTNNRKIMERDERVIEEDKNIKSIIRNPISRIYNKFLRKKRIEPEEFSSIH